MHKILWTFLIVMMSTSYSFANPPKTNPATVSTAIVNATGGQPLALQITSIIRNVQSAGYPLIKEIELKDGVYRVKAIDAQGLDISLVIDPQRGSILKPNNNSKIRFSLLDAITQVISKGYHGIYRVEADDGSYDVYAIDDSGNKVTLEVNAVSGEVSKSWF